LVPFERGAPDGRLHRQVGALRRFSTFFQKIFQETPKGGHTSGVSVVTSITTMKFTNAAYWATTSIVAFVLLSGGMASLAHRPENVEGMARLGYPAYLLTILGFWKVLGALALLAPRFPRLKEWAYAGAVFDLTGAAWSHASSGAGPAHIFWPAFFALAALASWALRPQGRIIGALLPRPGRTRISA
jgi:uncharacterized membrane protein YphA (DoxX/SURF4 family)